MRNNRSQGQILGVMGSLYAVQQERPFYSMERNILQAWLKMHHYISFFVESCEVVDINVSLIYDTKMNEKSPPSPLSKVIVQCRLGPNVNQLKQMVWRARPSGWPWFLATRDGWAAQGAGSLFLCVWVSAANSKGAQCRCQDRKVKSRQASLLCRCFLAPKAAVSLSPWQKKWQKWMDKWHSEGVLVLITYNLMGSI